MLGARMPTRKLTAPFPTRTEILTIFCSIALLLHWFATANLHAPFKRAWGKVTSPERAMLGARRKMARTGHTDQADGRSSFRASRAGPPAQPRRHGRRPQAYPGRWT